MPGHLFRRITVSGSQMISHCNRETSEEMTKEQCVRHTFRWQQSQHIRHQLAGPSVADIGVINNGEAPLPLGLPILMQEPSLQLFIGILCVLVDALQQGAHGDGDGLRQNWHNILVFGTGHNNVRPGKLRFCLNKPDVRVRNPESGEFDGNVCDCRRLQCCGRHLLTDLEASKLFVDGSGHTLFERFLLTHRITHSTGTPPSGGRFNRLGGHNGLDWSRKF
jgi:hypothetical protein